MKIDLEYEFEQETNKCMWDVDGTYSGSYIEWLESKAKQLLIQRVVVPKGTLCEHKFKDLKFIRDRQIKCKCGKYFSY